MADVSKVKALNPDDMESYAKLSLVKRAVRTKAFPLLVLLLVLIGVFTIIAPLRNEGFQTFFRMRTFWRILQDIAVPGFLTIGAGCLIVSGNIDLSNANVGSLAGVIVAAGIAWWDLHWLVAIIIAVAAAAVVGTINAILVNELKQAPFVATIAMSTILTAVMMILSTDKSNSLNATINYNHDIVPLIGQYKIFEEVPAASIVMALCFLIYGLALSKTKFGRTLYLMGGNRSATYLAGINPRKISYFLFINSSVLATFSGFINVARTKQGASGALSLHQFAGFTAAILGGISFGGGSGGMGGAFLGLLVINTFSMGLTMCGATPYLTNVLTGALLLAALTFDYFSIRAQNRRVGA